MFLKFLVQRHRLLLHPSITRTGTYTIIFTAASDPQPQANQVVDRPHVSGDRCIPPSSHPAVKARSREASLYTQKGGAAFPPITAAVVNKEMYIIQSSIRYPTIVLVERGVNFEPPCFFALRFGLHSTRGRRAGAFSVVDVAALPRVKRSGRHLLVARAFSTNTLPILVAFVVVGRYLTACANDFCREAKRQTISAQDVMQAIKELEFGELEEPLREYLDQVYLTALYYTRVKIYFLFL